MLFVSQVIELTYFGKEKFDNNLLTKVKFVNA